jgi:hypothetical protein
MRVARRMSGCLLAPLVLVACGCAQHFELEKTVTVTAGNFYVVGVDPPRSSQKVTVAVSAPAKFSVFLVLDNKDVVDKALNQGVAPAASLDKKEGVQEATLEATVPGKSGYAVLIRNDSPRDEEVHVKISGR